MMLSYPHQTNLPYSRSLTMTFIFLNNKGPNAFLVATFLTWICANLNTL